MKRLLRALPLLLCLTLAPACTTNPATGESQLNMLSESEEISIGEQATPEFLQQFGGEISSPEIQVYIRDLGQRLAAVSERPDLPWAFYVVDSSTVNAFALPGGKVFISRGLLAEMENEAQLAGVLGHEIGHVTAEHIGQQMTRNVGYELGMVLLGTAAGQSNSQWLRVLGVGAEIGGPVILLGFSREQENQADELGLRYMSRLGYNPLGQLQVMEILKAQAGSQAGPPEFLSTHPLPATRIDRIRSLIEEDYPGYDDPRQYRFDRDRFQARALEELAKLPPAKHDPK